MSKRGMKSDLAALVKKYKLKEVRLGSKKFPREKKAYCPFGPAGGKHDEYCVCSGRPDDFAYRAEYVNAEKLWVGKIDQDTILVALYESLFTPETDFFSVRILFGEKGKVRLTGGLNYEAPHGTAYAHTSYWDGDVAGSAIPRHPPELTGFLYRGEYEGRDGHFLPDDIVAHLRTLRPKE